MSMLRAWWGGTAQGDAEEKSPDGGERGEEASSGEPDKQEGATNPWVKGFGDIVSSVSGYASNIKDTVSNTVQKTSFLSEFDEEQKKFERERQRQKDTAVPPWVGFNEEEQMKAQILRLSADSRNVLRNPPPGIQFNFDYTKSYPVALALLKEDSRLQKLRFELVPKKLKEERFWHNYFYRVFLIKQSSQLSTLASAEQRLTSSPPTSPQDPTQGDTSSSPSIPDSFTDVGTQEPQNASAEDFASDALVMGPEDDQTISRESVRAELDQLGVDSQPDVAVDQERWEEELAKELEDLGLGEEGSGGEEGTGDQLGEEHWESELQQILESHPEDTG